MSHDKTIRELQTSLPWTVHYAKDFRASPMAHKDFGHALLHVTKACGQLASQVNDAEHGGCEFKPENVDRFVADFVVCALRLANTCPGRTIDLQKAVEDRIRTKNATESTPAKPVGVIARRKDATEYLEDGEFGGFNTWDKKLAKVFGSEEEARAFVFAPGAWCGSEDHIVFEAAS